MAERARLQIVGGGKMGEALLGGLLASGWATPAEIRVVEKLGGRRAELTANHPGVEVTDTAGDADGWLLATKPGDIPATAAQAAAGDGTERILSIAAGVTTATIEDALGGKALPVIRAMPNTPALVGEGAAAIAPGTHAGDDDLQWADQVLSSVGSVAHVSEAQLDAVTGLSGSGPAYVFMVAEAMIEAGVLNGLSRDVSETLARQTLLGAATLLARGDRSAADLRADVTSPGGTTAAGLRSLEQHGLRAAFLDAVTAAADRARALG